MPNRVKFAHGNPKNIDAALAEGIINERDFLCLVDDDGNASVGWIDKDGTPVLVQDKQTDLSELEADVAELETAVSQKADTVEVDEKLDQMAAESVATANAYTDGKIEATIAEHLAKMYEFTTVPAGTLIDYREDEIRVMCPSNAIFTKQSVGATGDANCYYGTLKTYVPSDAVVGYIEHINGEVDKEILNTFSTDEYGRRYQPTWLPLAKYDEATDAWTYYGKNSSVDKYIGWDYQIDWYDANGLMIASDSVRINLSNEDCHSSIEPYYLNGAIRTANEYTDAQIEARLAEACLVEVVEF